MTKFAYVNKDSVFYNYSDDIVRVEETNFFNSDTKVIILRGISGSGKSTVAKKFIADNANTIIISRDTIRKNIFGAGYSKPVFEMEEIVSEIVETSIKGAMAAGNNIILDETFIKNRFVSKRVESVFAMNTDVVVVNFGVDVNTAKERVAKRVSLGGHDVPVEAIERMYDSFTSAVSNAINFKAIYNKVRSVKEFAPYVCKNPSMNPVYIFDIDGTLAKIVPNKDGVTRSAYAWDKVGEDDVKPDVAYVLKQLEDTHDIVIMSGRSDKCFAETTQWLKKHNISYNELLMRKSNDMRDDSIVKRELLEHVENNYGIVKGVFDDRDRVVSMWRKIGLTCFQVDYGAF